MNKEIYKLLFEQEEGEDSKPAPDKEGTDKAQKSSRRGRRKRAPRQKQGQPKVGQEVGEISAKTGKGNWKQEIKDAESLASTNPRQLMKNLGIKDVKDGSLDVRLLDIIRKSIYGTRTMQEAFLGASVKGVDKDIRVALRGITPRDGAKYMSLVLIGAQNAGVLGELTQNIKVVRTDDTVEIRIEDNSQGDT